MERSSFFNAVIDQNGIPDRSYLAEDFARYFSTFIGNGVFPNPANQLQVVAVDDNMQIRIKAGFAWINGYMYENTDDYIFKLYPADGVLNRIDRVVLRLDFLERKIKAVVKKGEYGSSPKTPNLQRDSDAYEIAIADVLVRNGLITVTQANVTDLRLNKELCGIVHGVVDQVDPTAIFNQFQTWYSETKEAYNKDISKWTKDKKEAFDKWYSENTKDFLDKFNKWYEDNTKQWENEFSSWFKNTEVWTSEFNNWFNNIKTVLDGDIAAKLTLKVVELEKEKIDKSEFNSFKDSTESQLADIATDIENIDLNADKVTLDSSSFKSKNVKGALEEVFTSGVSKKNKLVSILTSNGFEELTTNNTWEKILNTMESYNLVKNCIQLQEKFYGQFMINNKFLYRNDNKVIVELLTNDSYVLSDGTYDRPDIVLNDEDYFIFYYSNSRTMHCFKKSNKIWQKTFKTDDVSNVIVKFGRVYINNYSTGQITSLLLENGNEVASYSGQQLLQIGVGKYNEIFGLEHISTGYNGKEYYKLHKWSEGVHSESANFEFGFAGQRVNLNKIYFNFDLDKDCVYLTCFGVLTGCRILKLNNNLEPIAERNNDLEREVSVGANRKNIIIGANLYFDTNNKGYGIVKIDKDLNKEEYMTDVYFNAIFDSFGYVYISSEQRVIKYKIY